MLQKKFSRPYPLWPRHFGKKVILLTSLMIVLGTVALTSYHVTEVSKFEYDNAQEMLGAIGENLGLGLSHHLAVRDYGEIEQLLLHAAKYPGIRSLTVTDASGRVLVAVQRELDKPAIAVFNMSKLIPPTKNTTLLSWRYGLSERGNPFALGLDATELGLWHPIENGELGWLQINYSVDDVRSDVIQLIEFSLLFAVLGIVALALLLSRLLQPNLLALSKATDFARSLNKTDGQQLPPYKGSVEIEQLIHELNEASTRLYDQKIAIRDSANLLMSVLDASTEISIIVTDLDGKIILFNRGAEQLLGYSSTEMVGKHTPAIFHLPDEVKSRALELSQELGYTIEGFSTFHEIADLKGAEERQWTYVRKSGEHVPVTLVITTMRSYDGEITGHLGIAQDITERRRIDQMKSEFVSTVSHELRTPLTAIAGALGLIVGGALGEIPETAKQMINIAHKNSQRLTFLINDLLDMEKLVAGKMHFDMKQQLLMPLIEQSLDDNRTYGAARRVTLLLNSAAPDVVVYVDSQRLLQIMSNLLSNAIKYSPEDDSVEISVQTHENMVRVRISDHGHGIPADFFEHIFSKFSQADSSNTRQKGGTGLGLAITRELVERMGGTIGFDSVENQGASFYVDFPKVDVQTANKVPPTNP